jgi:hypothetical protein
MGQRAMAEPANRMKLTKPIHNLQKTLEWETVDQILIAGVWPIQQKNELDCDNQLNDEPEQCYHSQLNDLLLMKEEDGKLVKLAAC